MTLPMPGAAGAAVRVRLLGVDVRVHLGFVALAALIGLRLGGGRGLAAGTALVLLAVLAHELGHAAAAQAFGLRPSIELYWLGGLTSFEGATMLSRRRRIAVAAAGPFAGAAVGTAAWLVGTGAHGLRHAAASLAFGVGVVLGLVNLAPVLPLDGGRVLADLPSGNPARRLRVARFVSIAAGAVAVIVASLLGQLLVGVFSGWLVVMNVQAIRRESAPGSLLDELADALSRVDTQSAEAAEELATRAMDVEDPRVRMYAATLLVASHLVCERYAAARQVADTGDSAWVMAAYRDLAVLGDGAARVLEARLADDPADGDVRAAAVLYCLRGDWDRLTAIACSPLGARLDSHASLEAQTCAFRKGAFRSSALIGQAAEERGTAGPVERYDIACAWARAGEPEAAVAALDRAASAGWGDAEMLDRDEDLDTLRHLPDFQAVRRRMVRGRVGPTAGDRATPRRGAALALLGCGVLSAVLVRSLPETATFGFPDGAGVTEVVGLDLHTGVLRWRAPLDVLIPSISAAGPYVAVGPLQLQGLREPRSEPVRILDPLDGTVVTTMRTKGRVVAEVGGVALVEEFEDGEAVVRGMAIRTGTEQWSRPIGTATVITVAGVAVVTAFEQGPGLRGLDVSTGKERWRRDDLVGLREPPPGNPVVLAMTADGDRLAGLDPLTGAEVWSGPLGGSPSVVSAKVWDLDPSADLALIDAVTGARRNIRLDDPVSQPLAGVGETAVVKTDTGIAAVDLTTGRVLWAQRAQRTTYQARVTEDVVVTEWGGGMVAYDLATGRRLWRDGGDVTSLSLADGVVLLARADGVMEARRATTGEVLWTAPAAGSTTPPEVLGTTVILGRR